MRVCMYLVRGSEREDVEPGRSRVTRPIAIYSVPVIGEKPHRRLSARARVPCCVTHMRAFWPDLLFRLYIDVEAIRKTLDEAANL
jgi:hypothetical protein